MSFGDAVGALSVGRLAATSCGLILNPGKISGLGGGGGEALQKDKTICKDLIG